MLFHLAIPRRARGDPANPRAWRVYRDFVSTPLSTCEARDPKGLYAKARSGALPSFTGIDSPYEPPEHADLVLDTDGAGPEDLANRVVELLVTRGMIGQGAD